MKKILLLGAIIILTQIAQANTKTLTLRNLESDMHYQLKENSIYLEKLTDEEGFLDYYDRKVTLDYLFGDKEHYDEKGIGVFTNLNPDIALKITGITSKKKDIESDIVGFQLGYKDTDGFMLFDSYSSYLMTANYYSNKYKAIETEDYLINLSTQTGRIIDISENTFADVYLTAGAGFYYFGRGQDMNTEIKKDSGFMGNIGLGMTYNMSFYDFKSYIGGEYMFNYLENIKSTPLMEELDKNYIGLVAGLDYIISERLAINTKYTVNKLGNDIQHTTSIGFTFLF